jgi:hypothetical protein
MSKVDEIMESLEGLTLLEASQWYGYDGSWW